MLMALITAFSEILLDPRSSLDKPRTLGLTMATHYQVSIGGLEGLFSVAGNYINIFKVATGTARLFSKEHLLISCSCSGATK